MIESKIIKNVVYAETSNECHTADVYLPKTAGKDIPFVIAVHGGAFQAGAKEMYSLWGPYLAERGIGCMAINYTLASPNQAAYPSSLDEMEEAIKFVVRHARDWHVDPLKIGFMGDSVGAYFGTLAAIKPQRSSAKIKFVISAYGVLDVIEWYNYTNQTRSDFVVNKFFGSDYETSQTLYEQASPLQLFKRAVADPMFDTAFYVLWGTVDEIVLPKNQSEAFIDTLEKYKIPYSCQQMPDKGHFWFTKNDDVSEAQLPDFLAEDIGPKLVKFIQNTVTKQKKSDPNSDQ